MSSKSSVLLPLYIYPLPGAWDPLYESIAANPGLNFTVILNPHNGPGPTPFPDTEYDREIKKLNSYPNVCTIGYIRIDYCKRDILQVWEEVDRYAGWATDPTKSGIAVHGIFFDETPNNYSASFAFYLDSISQKVKSTPGILGNQLVIHNPGTIPDIGFAKTGPEVTVVLEESYAQYQMRPASLDAQLLARNYARNRCSYVVHSVPRMEVKPLVQELRRRGEYLFVTDLCEDYYVRFGPSWRDFIEAMGTDSALNTNAK